MTDLRLICRRCAKETPASAADPSGLCVLCLIGDAVLPFRAEYARLWAKRRRYIHSGISPAHCERQLARVARRLGDQVHARIVNPQVAIPIINAHLEEVRSQVERPNARILLPKTGDMLRSRLASA